MIGTFIPAPAKIAGPRIVRVDPPSLVDYKCEASLLPNNYFWAASVWDDNLDFWTDENGVEQATSDGPPGYYAMSYHWSEAGAEAAAAALRAQGVEATARKEYKGEWDEKPILP